MSALDQRNYHTTEGIFRISAPASEVEALKELYESGKEIQWTGYDAHVLAGVIVNYLLNLPEPLTSFELYAISFSVLPVLGGSNLCAPY